MESSIMDKIPEEAIDMMTLLFERGNIVKDFKIIGNQRGFSMTLHICQPAADSVMSPVGGSSTPSHHKSYATSTRDRQRRATWLSKDSVQSQCYLQLYNTKSEIMCDVQNKCAEVQTCDTECITEAISDTDMDTCMNSKTLVDVNSENSKEYDKINLDKVCEGKKLPCSAIERTQSVLKDNDDEKQTFKKNVNNHCRNAMFSKIVKNHMQGDNCIVGLSDDLLIMVENKSFKHWLPMVTVLSDNDEEYRNVINCVNGNQNIDEDDYVEETKLLNLLLDKLVVQHQDYV